jgi:hypothetical protein
MNNTIPFLSLLAYLIFGLSSCQALNARMDAEQYYYLQAVHSGKYLQLAQNTKEPGVGFIQAEPTGEETQQFKFFPVEEGFFEIIVRSSGLVMDIYNSSTDNRAPVIQWPYFSTANQHFRLEAVGEGVYLIQAKHSNKYLDVEWAGMQNGAPLIQWDGNGNPNQQFRLIPVEEKSKVVQPAPVYSDYESELKKVRNELTRGVRRVAAPGVPGPLILSGKNVFPIVAAKDQNGVQQPVVAAAYYGQGRVVAFGHDGFFGQSDLPIGETRVLLKNALRWSANKNQGDLRIGVYSARNLVEEWQSEQGLSARMIDRTDWSAGLKNFDVIVCKAGRLSSSELATLQSFVQQGGGILFAGLGWGWQSLNPEKDLLQDFPGNALFQSAGIVWSASYAPDPPEGYVLQPSISSLCNAAVALETIRNAGQALSGDDKKQAWFALGQAASMDMETEQIDAFLQDYQRQPDFPGGDFPAAVPGGTPRITGSLKIPAKDLNVDQAVWHSTGFYAAPGDKIRVQVDPALARKGLQVQIGAHSDQLWHKDKWERFPSIVRSTPIAEQETWVSNPFGGLIYIKAPAKLNLPDAWFTFHNVIQSPSFVLGKNSLEEWRNGIRNQPAPWAELVTDKVVITVPSDKFRQVDDPVRLGQFWDQVLDLTADLAIQPRNRQRPERIVPDKQISAGYMHSGYPIMTHLDAIDRMLSVEQLQTAWGLYHELGHNHQHPDWTFNGTVEVTCNLFTLYVREKATGFSPRKAFMDLGRRTGPEVYYAEQKRIPSSQKFNKWKSDPFLALAMYIQLQEAFGWETYMRVFKEYSQLPASERPKNDDEKRDQWLVRFSKAAGKNLGPFFDEWGVPVSNGAKEQVAHLPVWMP